MLQGLTKRADNCSQSAQIGRGPVGVIVGLGLALAVGLTGGLWPIGAIADPTAASAAPLQSLGLTNSFGQDAVHQRVFNWLGLKSASYTDPYIKLVELTGSETPSANDLVLAPAQTTGCTITPVAYTMTTYNAYTCTVSDLLPGASYAYLVGAKRDDQAFESAVATFTTESAADADAFTFLDFADSQSSPVTQYAPYWGNTLAAALTAHPEARIAIQNGDITEAPDAANITAWLDAADDQLGSIAFNPVLGNHDSPSAAQPMWDAIFPRDTWPQTDLPDYADAGALEYAQIYGNALFLYINTNLDSTADLKKTSQWIESTVTAHGTNADGTSRFIIAVEHKSPFGGLHSGAGAYPTGDYGNPQIVAELPKTFDKVGVDLVLAGHDHNLIRSLPIQWDDATGKASWDRAEASLDTINSDDDGLIYYIPRNSGEKTYPLIPEPTTTSRPWIAWRWSPPGNYTAADNTVYAAVTVTRTEIQVKAYRAGDPDTPVDQFTITQNNSTPLPPVDPGRVMITGVHQVGETLHAYASPSDAASAEPDVPQAASLLFSYQWMRDGTPIPGATSAAHTITAADLTAHLTVEVTTSAEGFASSSQVWPALKIGSTGRVRVAGDATVGSTLTASTDGPVSVAAFATLTWFWVRVDATGERTPIPGAMESTYSPTTADLGQSIMACLHDVDYPKPMRCSAGVSVG
ncbi:MAG: metallophosphoesterase [Propionibacteriaceae bacterium]|jgi:hypothetical protein|nr:metallophosphoesterase [Propionibacteriaceae bacterium]